MPPEPPGLDEDLPGLHPEPPADFASRELPFLLMEGAFFRIHQLQHGALYFGKSGRGRFDGSDQLQAVCYVAEDEHGAFIESFGRHLGQMLLNFTYLAARGVSLVRIKEEGTTPQPLKIASLVGDGLPKMGADARLTTGSYIIARQWANAIAAHPQNFDGISYMSRHDNTRRCVALFERCQPRLETVLLRSYGDAQEAGVLASLLDHYGFGLEG
jgi:hypothetical protein